jgi:hypothetical protein
LSWWITLDQMVSRLSWWITLDQMVSRLSWWITLDQMVSGLSRWSQTHHGGLMLVTVVSGSSRWSQAHPDGLTLVTVVSGSKRARGKPVPGFGQILKHRLHLGTSEAFRSSRGQLKRAMPYHLAIGSILHPIRGTIQLADITRIPRRVGHAKKTRARLAGCVGDKDRP